MRLRHRHRSLPGTARPVALAVAALLVLTAYAPAVAAPPGKPPGERQFSSSFETGDPQPAWLDTVETGPDGAGKTSGVGPESGPGAGMSSHPDSGPTASPTARTNAGFSGLRALRYAGTHTASGRGYSYNKVFDVDLPVTAATSLSYKIFPEMAATDLG
ncbi:GH92 family glycosyl hydrolase, partial [Streptomyces rimosus]